MKMVCKWLLGLVVFSGCLQMMAAEFTSESKVWAFWYESKYDCDLWLNQECVDQGWEGESANGENAVWANGGDGFAIPISVSSATEKVTPCIVAGNVSADQVKLSYMTDKAMYDKFRFGMDWCEFFRLWFHDGPSPSRGWIVAVPKMTMSCKDVGLNLDERKFYDVYESRWWTVPNFVRQKSNWDLRIPTVVKSKPSFWFKVGISGSPSTFDARLWGVWDIFLYNRLTGLLDDLEDEYDVNVNRSIDRCGLYFIDPNAKDAAYVSVDVESMLAYTGDNDFYQNDGIGGTATGAGVYDRGATVTLTAKPWSGFVFAGWGTADGDCDIVELCRQAGVDYRAPTVKLQFQEHVSVAANFVRVEDDSLWLCWDEGQMYCAQNDGTFRMDLGELIESASLPKITVKNLPAGLKFDAKANVINGKATKPGIYAVEVSVSNALHTTPLKRQLIIRVPNFRSGHYDLDYDGAYETKVGQINLPLTELVPDDPSAVVAVSGLPAGLKFDAKTRQFTGYATKAGSYTAVITTTIGKTKYTDTITFSVSPIHPGIVGTFNGFISDDKERPCGTFQLTASEVGKLAAKIVTASGTYSFAGNGWIEDDDSYTVSMSTKKGERLSIRVLPRNGFSEDGLSGNFELMVAGGSSDQESRCFYDVQAGRRFLGNKWPFKVYGSEYEGWSLLPATAADADVIISTKTDGTATLAGIVGGNKVSTSTVILIPSLKLTFAPVVKIKSGKSTINKVLKLSANLTDCYGSGEAELFEPLPIAE